nr:hypothetical protein [Valsa mali var. pyri (nom. inval.)]
MLAKYKKYRGIIGKAKKVVLISVLDNKTINLDSLSACVKFFKDLGCTTSSNTLVSRIKLGVEYNGYIVKFAEDQISTHPRSPPFLPYGEVGGVDLNLFQLLIWELV